MRAAQYRDLQHGDAVSACLIHEEHSKASSSVQYDGGFLVSAGPAGRKRRSEPSTIASASTQAVTEAPGAERRVSEFAEAPWSEAD